MNNIKSHYSDYSELIQTVGEQKILSRFEYLLKEVHAFINILGPNKDLLVNESILMHVVLEYFQDIVKLKKAHNLEHVNDPKVLSYIAYWFLKRKPIQNSSDDESLIFVNEKFVLSMIINSLLQNNENKPLLGDNLNIYQGFLNSLFYYLKFRHLDAQSLEMIIMAFHTGKLFK